MKFLLSFTENLTLYLQNTSIHGFRFLIDREAYFFEKVFWIIVSCLSIAGLYFLFIATWTAYKSNPISFVTETSYLSWNTTFPAVAVCEAPSAGKIEAFAEYIKGSDRHALFDNFLSALLEYSECTNCHRCPEKEGMCDVEIQSIFQYYSSCRDLLTDCVWGEEGFDCCSRFKPLKTQYGLCYVMNSMQTEGSIRQSLLVTNRKGRTGMLKLNINERADLSIMTTEEVPYLARPQWQHALLEYGSNFNLKFQVTEIVNDELLEDIDVAQRMCRFPTESSLVVYPYYSFSACVVQCIIQQQIKLCGCQHHFMPGEVGEVCDIEGLGCLNLMWPSFNEITLSINDTSALYCDCLPSCTESEFQLVYTKESSGEPATRVTLQMENYPTKRFIRNVVRTKLDLVVSIGGAAGLFLGASLLSVVEIIYFFCVRSKNNPPEVRNKFNKRTNIAKPYDYHYMKVKRNQESFPAKESYGRYYPKDYGHLQVKGS